MMRSGSPSADHRQSRPHVRSCAALAVLVVLAMLAGFAAPALPTSSAAPAIPANVARVRAALAMNAPMLFQSEAGEDELDGFELTPLDPAMDPDQVLRSRPFIIGDDADSAFPDRMAMSQQIDEVVGRDRLLAFLQIRGVGQETIDEALGRYDDRKVKKIVPEPALRSALLMMSGWDPYKATIAAVLDGKNPSGEPYATVAFEDLGMVGAIATLMEDPATGRHLMYFDSGYEREMPEVLIPTMVHEALHGGGGNSAEEELIANILDTICWAELLLINPELAYGGSDLAFFNNVKLIGLLNSSGRGGPGQIGVATSPVGDIYVGDGLEDVDAESIRAIVESDWFYDALRNVGSEGQQTTAALLRRFPGGKGLGKKPRYDEEMLAVIDAGVSKVLPPDRVVQLAVTLGLDLAGPFSEGRPKGKISKNAESTLSRRPLMPGDQKFFGFATAKKAPKALNERAGRKALTAALAKHKVADATATKMLAQYDDPEVQALIPDPSLRAATLLLGGLEPWSASYDVVLNGANPDGVPLRVEFTPMRDSAPAARRSHRKDGAAPALLVNSLLVGESPELLASVIVEGTLLHDQVLTKEEAIAAAVIGTFCWADLVAADAKVAAARTWGVLARNEHLLALLNTTSNRGGVGVLVDQKSIADILPGVYTDATTFAGYLDAKPWGVRFDRRSDLVAPPVFIAYLTFAGVEPTTGMGNTVSYSEATLKNLDAAVPAFLPPDRVYVVARALKLGTAAR